MIHEDLQQHLIQRPSHLAAAQGHFHQNGETDDADNRKNDEDDQNERDGGMYTFAWRASVSGRCWT